MSANESCLVTDENGRELGGDPGVYDAPELIEVGPAVKLIRGPLMDRIYWDCGYTGFTDHRPTC